MTCFSPFPEDLSNIRILLTNDDGINAPGLKVLEKIARSISKDVWIVAPEQEQSGVAHSLTMHEPLRVRKIAAKRFAVRGTPTDCVLMATKMLLPKKKKIDLLLSGVNKGANAAEDVTYSGTVAGAMEGTLLNIPSIALSLSTVPGENPFWETAEIHAANVIRTLLKTSEWHNNTLLNINFPKEEAERVKGVKLAPLGQRAINDKITAHTDPFKRPYYWIGCPLQDDFNRPDVDLAWLYKGYITVTPLCLDLTHHKMMESMESLFKQSQEMA